MNRFSVHYDDFHYSNFFISIEYVLLISFPKWQSVMSGLLFYLWFTIKTIQKSSVYGGPQKKGAAAKRRTYILYAELKIENSVHIVDGHSIMRRLWQWNICQFFVAALA